MFECEALTNCTGDIKDNDYEDLEALVKWYNYDYVLLRKMILPIWK